LTEQQLKPLFQQCAGFQEVRIVPGNRGLAFVEFENEVQSGIALRTLNGFQLTPNYLLNLTYSQ
jgi:RNA recognition motif-containing protein